MEIYNIGVVFELQQGNRSSSSACGSADVLEALGVIIDLDPEVSAAKPWIVFVNRKEQKLLNRNLSWGFEHTPNSIDYNFFLLVSWICYCN